LLRRDHQFNTRKRARIDRLQNQLAVSAQSIDEARTAEDLARLRMRAATEKQRIAQLEAARDTLALERRIVRSPINGVVVKRYKSAGEYVDGEPIVQLVQLDPLRVQVVAPPAMFGSISVGMQGTVVPDLPIDGPFEASVISIDPVMDVATATFRVRLPLPNPGHRLPPGLKCTLVLRAQVAPVAEIESTKRPAPQAKQRMPAASNDPVDDLLDDAPIALAYPLPEESSAEPVPALKSAQEPTPAAVISSATSVADRQTRDLRAHQGMTLGPLASDLEASALAATLSAHDVNFERRLIGNKSELESMWTVLSIGSGSSPQDLLQRTRRAEISDFQLLTRGAWKDRISYGTYRGKHSAQRRVDALTARGFNVVIVDRRLSGAKIWFDLTHVSSAQTLDAIVSSVRDEYPRLSARSMYYAPTILRALALLAGGGNRRLPSWLGKAL
jgi:hypothetical protein